MDEATETIATAIVQSAFAVHSALGPGLLESVYEVCLAHELNARGVAFERQVSLPMVVELKAVETLLPVHKAQMLTYLKLSGHRLGLRINFNVPPIKDGIKRVVL